jgi:type IV pilus assembly protein PilF
MRTALDDGNKLAELNVNMAVEYMNRGENETALKRLGTALKHDPRNGLAHSTLAILYTKLGKTADAEKHFKQSVRYEPGSGRLLNNYGQFLCAQKRPNEGLEMFAAAIQDPLYRTPQFAYSNAGTCALADNAELAEQHFRSALRIDPILVPALFYMASLSHDQGKHLQARGYLQRYKEVARPNAPSLWLRIRIERQLGNRDSVSSDELSLRELFPDSKETHLLQSESQ